MEPSIYFVTTKNCNLGCDHCYLRAGPGQKGSTISSKNFEKAIKNFPKKKILCYNCRRRDFYTKKISLMNFLIF